MDISWLEIPLSIFAFLFGMALLLHGLPSINIGNRTNKYYTKKEENNEK